MAGFEESIAKLESALEEVRAETRNAHEATRGLREIKREITQLLAGDDVKKLVEIRTEEVVKRELDRIGPQMRQHTNDIYDRVGKQIDLLIDLSLGKELAKRSDKGDLRPLLAAKLKEWLKEILQEMDVKVIEIKL